MAYLRQFWVDKLKIDRSFLEAVDTSPGDAAIVDAVIALGNKLHMEVLAEGVERCSQVQFLRRHGCTRAQGFLLGRPPEAAELARRLGRSGTRPITTR